MATVDGSGYNTSSLFQAKDYDSSALATGLQSAATYDPTQQSTANPASSVQYQQNLNSPNTAFQDTASSTQNSSSPNISTPQTAATTGLTAQSNNTPYMSYRSNLVTAPISVAAPAAQTVGGAGMASSTAATGAPASGLSTTIGNTTVSYKGPQVVSTNGTYWVFDPNKGTYVFAGSKLPGGLTGAVTYAGANGYSLTDAQMNAAVQIATNGNIPAGGLNLSDVVTQSPITSTALSDYNKAKQQATTDAQATATAAAGTSAYQQALDYMTTHNGQLPQNLQAIASNVYTGSGAALPKAQQAAIAQAQAAYQAQQANAAALAGIKIKPIDTSAVDASNQAAMSALISQYASGNAAFGGGGNASTQNASALSGQNVLNHNIAAATSYNSNIANYNNALATQYAADKAASGNQLYSDIQGVQQIAAQLQQEMGQLDTKHQQEAQAQLNQLQNLLNQYQQAVAQYGQGSSQAMQTATGILSAAGSVAALGA